MLTISYQNRPYQLERFPYLGHSTWLPWTTAEQQALRYVDEHFPAVQDLVLYQDRFGVLATLWANRKPRVVVTHASHQAALAHHLKQHQIDPALVTTCSLLDPLERAVPLAVLSLPKSLELLDWYFQHLSAQLTPDATVVVGFMTKHFTPRLLALAEQYFGQVEQSRAWKKSRLLVLRQPRPHTQALVQHALTYQGLSLVQYYGVFSAQHIDYASQFLLDHLPAPAPHSKGLDLACGNGILGVVLQHRTPNCSVTYLDDFEPALASARRNVAPDASATFHWSYHLNDLPAASFDWVVCNPPFHLEHDLTTAVAHGLFQQTARCLVDGGRFWVVANRHLKYGGVLRAHFQEVHLLAQNQKFMIYDCRKVATVVS